MVEEYPSVELAYRAGDPDSPADTDATGPGRRRSPQLDQSGPALTVTLGDRTTAILSFTVRFALMSEHLRTVHEGFGPNGVFGIVRDESNRAPRNTLSDPSFGVQSLFGPAGESRQTTLADAIGAALEADGIRLGDHHHPSSRSRCSLRRDRLFLPVHPRTGVPAHPRPRHPGIRRDQARGPANRLTQPENTSPGGFQTPPKTATPAAAASCFAVIELRHELPVRVAGGVEVVVTRGELN